MNRLTHWLRRGSFGINGKFRVLWHYETGFSRGIFHAREFGIGSWAIQHPSLGQVELVWKIREVQP